VRSVEVKGVVEYLDVRVSDTSVAEDWVAELGRGLHGKVHKVNSYVFGIASVTMGGDSLLVPRNLACGLAGLKTRTPNRAGEF
jgi:hypothetical protein